MVKNNFKSDHYLLPVVKVITAFFLCLSGCISEVVEPEIEKIELYNGYSVQLTSLVDNAGWESDNLSVATISQTGLLTAVGAGKATIYNILSDGKKRINCYIEIFPKRNLLMYIATDEGASIDYDVNGKLKEIRTGWKPEQGELIIYADRYANGATMMKVNNIKGDDGMYGLDTLEVYHTENSADKSVVSRSINFLVNNYPADSYGMIFFSHASGWLPPGLLNVPRSMVIDKGNGSRYEMTVADFASAIPDGQFDFIIFEACLMSDVITMYEMRNKAEYVVASSAEIVAPGFEYIYRETIMSLFDTHKSVETTLKNFGQSWYDYITTTYLESSEYCSATFSLIKMSEMSALATAVKTALQGDTVKTTDLSVALEDIQTFDRPKALVSYGSIAKSRYNDLAHTVEKIVQPNLYDAFEKQLNKTVVWKIATKRFLLSGNDTNPDYTSYDGFFILHHCGLTTYIEQDYYPNINSAYEASAWFKATH